MQSIKNNLLNLMSEKRLTAYSLSKKTDLNVATVQNIIYGKSQNPTINVLSAIAKALDCSIGDLINENNTILEFSGEKWNPKLYLQTLGYISDLLLQKLDKDNLSYQKTMDIVNDAYSYSIETNKNIVDKEFCNWIVNKSF